MFRHPIYLVLCCAAVGYLALADARGWGLLHSLSRSLAHASSGSRGHSFNHK